MKYIFVFALLIFTAQVQAAPWNGDKWANSLGVLNGDISSCAQFPNDTQNNCDSMALLKRLKMLSAELQIASSKHPGTNSINSFINDKEHFSSMEMGNKGFDSLASGTSGMKYIHERMAANLKTEQKHKIK